MPRAVKTLLHAVCAATFLLLGVAAAPVASASTGMANPFACETVPVAESPTDGMSGWLLPAPKKAPTSVDATSGASLLQNYGVGGLSWFTFDDNCDFGAGGITDKPGETTNGVASAVFLPGVLVAASTVSAGNAFGNPEWLDFLNPVLGQISSALAQAFTAPLMPLFVLLTAVVGMVAASAGQLSKVLRSLVFVLIGLGVVGLTVGYPVKAATFVDDTVSSLVLTGQQTIVNGTGSTPSEADREQPGAAFVGPLYKALVWDTWLRGELGSDDSAVAKKYGYALYASRTLTYAEKATVDRDPSGAGKAVFDKKATQFKEVADKIKEEDPGAYNVLTTANFGQRFGLALGASAIAVMAFSLPFFSFILLLLCFLYWRFTIMLGPMLGAVMVMMHSVARSVARKLGAVVLNTIMFGVGAAVFVASARFITSSSLPFGWQVFALGVLTVVGWVILHPIRALTKFTEINTPGYDGVPGGDLARKGARMAMQYVVTRKAVDDATDDEAGGDAPNGGQAQDSPPAARPTHQWANTPLELGAAPTPAALNADPVRSGVIVNVPSLDTTSAAPPPPTSRDQVIDGEVVTSHPVMAPPRLELPPAVDDREATPPSLVTPVGRDDGIDIAADIDDTGGVYYDPSSKTFVDTGGVDLREAVEERV